MDVAHCPGFPQWEGREPTAEGLPPGAGSLRGDVRRFIWAGLRWVLKSRTAYLGSYFIASLYSVLSLNSIHANHKINVCFSPVNRLFGIWAWSFCVFLLILWRERSWGTTTACPYMLLEQYVEAGTHPLHIFLKIIAQITGAVISCRWVVTLHVLSNDCYGDSKGAMTRTTSLVSCHQFRHLDVSIGG